MDNLGVIGLLTWLPHATPPHRHMDNLGVMGLLDAYYQTTGHFDKSWQRLVHKAYGPTADYAVDKVLAKGGAMPPLIEPTAEL